MMNSKETDPIAAIPPYLTNRLRDLLRARLADLDWLGVSRCFDLFSFVTTVIYTSSTEILLGYFLSSQFF